MTKKGKCSRCKYDWYVCDNCRAAGCGNTKCSEYQCRDLYAIFASPKCRTCGKR